jgi:uncharacterized surface protein with fasciclin (FAS1) repeats
MNRTMAAAMLAVVVCAGTASAQGNSARHTPVVVGGQAMLPARDIVENAANSAEHTTLVAAVQAAGLVETLKGRGPFTVFAPVNDAFENLPEGTVQRLLRPENRAALTGVLTYHVVAGRLTAADLMQRIRQGHGSATLRTVSGGTLTAVMNGPGNVVIRDETGGVAAVTTYDVPQSNGVIHVVNRVLLPR